VRINKNLQELFVENYLANKFIYEGHMNEFKELSKLIDKNFIEEVNKLSIEKTGGDISICFPKKESQKSSIHFLLNTDNIISFFKIAEVQQFISESIKNNNIIVELKKVFKKEVIEKLFEFITPYKQENIGEIAEVLNKYNLKEITKKEEDESSEEENIKSEGKVSFWQPCGQYKQEKKLVEFEKLLENFLNENKKEIVCLSKEEKLKILNSFSRFIGIEFENIQKSSYQMSLMDF